MRAADAGLVAGLQPGLARSQDTAEAAELCGVMMVNSGDCIVIYRVGSSRNTVVGIRTLCKINSF